MRPNRKKQPFFKWVIRAGLHTGTQYDSDEETQRLDFFDH